MIKKALEVKKLIEISSHIEKTKVGVYITKNSIQKMLKQKPHERLEMLAKANNIAKTELYFFSIKDINVNSETINGTYYNEESKIWERKVFQYPNVIYKRGGGDTKGKRQRKKADTFYQQLKKLGTLPLNYQKGFNKWDIIKKLQHYSTISPHLPDTKKVKSTNVISEMLNNYSKVYIKGCKGRRGKQVIRVTKKDENVYEYRYYNNKLMVGTMNDINKLLSFIYESFGMKNLIVQQAIDLLETDGSVVDFRGEVQRNGAGKLEILAIPVRISQKNAPITTHASSYQLEEFLEKFLNYSNSEVTNFREQINHFLVNVYQSIEQEFGQIGELGIDFAIDKKGKLWFIESNSQSAKVSLAKAYEQALVEKAFLNPLQYAKFLHETKNR